MALVPIELLFTLLQPKGPSGAQPCAEPQCSGEPRSSLGHGHFLAKSDQGQRWFPEPGGLSLCPLLFQNASKASQSSRDTLSSGVHSWGSQAEARSSSWDMMLARGRPTDTPSYFNGTVP